MESEGDAVWNLDPGDRSGVELLGVEDEAFALLSPFIPGEQDHVAIVLSRWMGDAVRRLLRHLDNRRRADRPACCRLRGQI